MTNKRALFLGAHADDVEIGCGGFLQRFENKLIYAFTPAIESIPEGYAKDATIKEFNESSKKIGCECRLDNLAVRHFPKYRQYILEKLIELKKEFKPDIVFTHCSTDTHQDHSVIYNETIRAFKECSILGYGFPSNNYMIKYNYFVELTDTEFANKLEYVKCYETQVKTRGIIEIVNITSKYWGVILKKNHVEPFELIRWFQS